MPRTQLQQSATSGAMNSEECQPLQDHLPQPRDPEGLQNCSASQHLRTVANHELGAFNSSHPCFYDVRICTPSITEAGSFRFLETLNSPTVQHNS